MPPSPLWPPGGFAVHLLGHNATNHGPRRAVPGIASGPEIVATAARVEMKHLRTRVRTPGDPVPVEPDHEPQAVPEVLLDRTRRRIGPPPGYRSAVAADVCTKPALRLYIIQAIREKVSGYRHQASGNITVAFSGLRERRSARSRSFPMFVDCPFRGTDGRWWLSARFLVREGDTIQASAASKTCCLTFSEISTVLVRGRRPRGPSRAPQLLRAGARTRGGRRGRRWWSWRNLASGDPC